ncbi:MAG: hypothetical protein IIC50_17930 [Planctomycetes bacterium]|nr:hypothetical protein [Planctomycetota bacterium]
MPITEDNPLRPASPYPLSKVYNIGGNETMTIREMLDRLLALVTSVL